MSTMLKANMSPGYRWRLGLIGAACLLFAGWSAYDGFVQYPEYNRLVREVTKINEKNYPTDWQDRLKDFGVKHRIDVSEYRTEKTRESIWTQYIMLAIALPLGLIFGGAYLRSFGRWVASDEKGLTTSWGDEVPFNAITLLNKDKWKTKGIAVVTYKDELIERKLILDDWKYDAPTTLAILKSVESHLRPDQIVGEVTPPKAVSESSGSSTSPQ